MKIQLLSNEKERLEPLVQLLNLNLLSTTSFVSSHIEQHQDVTIVFPDQFSNYEWHQVMEDKHKIWYILLDDCLTEEERITSLEDGIDAIWSVHLSDQEILARVKAVLRIIEKQNLPDVLSFNEGEILIEPETKQVRVEDRKVELTASEYQLLLHFMQHPNRIYSRDELLVLLNNQRGMNRAIDTHIKNLRRKIKLNQRSFNYIKTIHGRGYRFQFQE